MSKVINLIDWTIRNSDELSHEASRHASDVRYNNAVATADKQETSFEEEKEKVG